MRRIQLVLAALANVVTSFAAFAGPAMANELDCHNARNQPDGIIRCDNGRLYDPYNRVNSPSFHDDFFYPCNPYFYNPYCWGYGFWNEWEDIWD